MTLAAAAVSGTNAGLRRQLFLDIPGHQLSGLTNHAKFPDHPDVVDTVSVFESPSNPGDDYGLRLDLSEAKLKIKCPDYPAHINPSFWRYEKQGERQLRFADENCTTACHMQSKSREIDHVTDEVKLGADAHAGIIDLAIEALYRTFRDRQSIPTDQFGEHSYPPFDLTATGRPGRRRHRRRARPRTCCRRPMLRPTWLRPPCPRRS